MIDRIPIISLRDYLKKNLEPKTLLGKKVFWGGGPEIFEWFWDDIRVTDEEARTITKVLIDNNETTMFDVYRKDFDSDEEYFEACIEDFSEGNIWDYFDLIADKEDCIYDTISF